MTKIQLKKGWIDYINSKPELWESKIRTKKELEKIVSKKEIAYHNSKFLPKKVNIGTKYKWQLVIVAIFNNEACFLKEWLDFHISIGVEYFSLYSNNSTDNFYQVLQPYVNQNIVEIFEWNFPFLASNGLKTQKEAYTDATNRFKGLARWLAFIDIDEFLFSPRNKNILNILNNYGDYPAITVNWNMFGTSNIEFIECGEKITNKLLYRADNDFYRNISVKTIANPEYIKVNHVHYCEYIDCYYAIDENFNVVPNYLNLYRQTDILRINHYFYRSIDFYKKKILRKRKVKGKITSQTIDNFIESSDYKECNKNKDTIIQKIEVREI